MWWFFLGAYLFIYLVIVVVYAVCGRRKTLVKWIAVLIVGSVWPILLIRSLFTEFENTDIEEWIERQVSQMFSKDVDD
jgi:hypothetical protein